MSGKMTDLNPLLHLVCIHSLCLCCPTFLVRTPTADTNTAMVTTSKPLIWKPNVTDLAAHKENVHLLPSPRSDYIPNPHPTNFRSTSSVVSTLQEELQNAELPFLKLLQNPDLLSTKDDPGKTSACEDIGSVLGTQGYPGPQHQTFTAPSAPESQAQDNQLIQSDPGSCATINVFEQSESQQTANYSTSSKGRLPSTSDTRSALLSRLDMILGHMRDPKEASETTITAEETAEDGTHGRDSDSGECPSILQQPYFFDTTTSKIALWPKASDPDKQDEAIVHLDPQISPNSSVDPNSSWPEVTFHGDYETSTIPPHDEEVPSYIKQAQNLSKCPVTHEYWPSSPEGYGDDRRPSMTEDTCVTEPTHLNDLVEQLSLKDSLKATSTIDYPALSQGSAYLPLLPSLDSTHGGLSLAATLACAYVGYKMLKSHWKE